MKLRINWFDKKPEIIEVDGTKKALFHILRILRDYKLLDSRPCFHVEYLYDGVWVNDHVHNSKVKELKK